MIENKILYYEHKRNKNAWCALESYIKTVLKDNIPDSIKEYKEYLELHFVKDVKPVLDYHNKEDLLDDEYPDYPSEQFLISLSETPILMDIKKFYTIIELMISAWNHNAGYVSNNYNDTTKHREYEFITGGWSGNEEIIDALLSNQLICAYLDIKSERGGYIKISCILDEY